MIRRKFGDLLHEVKEGIIVHGCNAQGRMGGGIALQVKETYPQAYQAYRDHYEKYGLKVGEVIMVEVRPRLYIANAITQEFYGWASDTVYVDYDGLQTCFEEISDIARLRKMDVHFPLIGCGLANGEWEIVSQRINAGLAPSIKRTLWTLE